MSVYILQTFSVIGCSALPISYEALSCLLPWFKLSQVIGKLVISYSQSPEVKKASGFPGSTTDLSSKAFFFSPFCSLRVSTWYRDCLFACLKMITSNSQKEKEKAVLPTTAYSQHSISPGSMFPYCGLKIFREKNFRKFQKQISNLSATTCTAFTIVFKNYLQSIYIVSGIISN